MRRKVADSPEPGGMAPPGAISPGDHKDTPARSDPGGVFVGSGKTS